MDEYHRIEVVAFVGSPLLVMVPPSLVPFLLIGFAWAASVWDMLGWNR